MELLDAALALVLTLGALGTIVTMLMELMFRVFCIRARFLKGMIQDYVLPEVLSIPAIKAAFAAVTGDAPTAQTAKAAERKLVEAIIGNPAEKVSLDRPIIGPGGAYDRITLEHFLSRLVEETGLRDRIDTARAEVRAALIESARIFDKMSGATVASFATRARGWSLVIGIILAFVANVDGLRLFETYRDSPETALAIIADQDGLAAADADATASFRAALALEAEVRVLEEKIKSANETEKAAAEEALVAKRQELAKLADPEAMRQLLAGSADILKSLRDRHLPIGWQQFPYCQKAEAGADALCGSDQEPDYVFWFFRVLVTGLLIGLGGPFWFDVAKRLAAVRTVLRGGKSDQTGPRTGEDPAGNAAPFSAILRQVDGVIDAFAAGLGAGTADQSGTQQTTQ
ncbi:MAG: hypothetical protein VX464_14020 [Pseudomonadota bacterium]|nr:hypothetical protein [Pseudomonadota bacterium]